MGGILQFGLLIRSELIRTVVGAYNAIGTMLRQSDQLHLAPENGHFEGSMHPEVKEGQRRDWLVVGDGAFSGQFFYFLHVWMRVTTK